MTKRQKHEANRPDLEKTVDEQFESLHNLIGLCNTGIPVIGAIRKSSLKWYIKELKYRSKKTIPNSTTIIITKTNH